ncbi:MAG: hypothetical protein QM532_02060 [Cyanobium sp. MAG06]|nr:hypothetical protein [Cyanobium sp. MAG06]
MKNNTIYNIVNKIKKILLSGDLFFGKDIDNNKNTKDKVTIKSKVKENKNIKSKLLEKVDTTPAPNIHNSHFLNLNNTKNNKIEHTFHIKIEEEKYNMSENKIPQGYVKMVFNNIDIAMLYIKHNIILKYIKIDDNLYVKSFILNHNKDEYLCHNNGENLCIYFKQKNDSILEICAENIIGDREYLHIINGKLIDY